MNKNIENIKKTEEIIMKNFGNKSKIIINNYKKNKNKIKMLIPIALISFIFLLYMIVKTFINVRLLNNEKGELYELNNFNIKVLENNEYTKNNINSIKTINSLIDYEIELENDIKKYEGYLNNLQIPYNNLMKHILLPSLNIRKDPFLGNIDINIMGVKFLEQNPYDDIKLIKKWSEFFKNVGSNNEFNKIDNITIGEITENGENFFIPIKINFIANSKRSFLLLVEKLSITSNQSNISLINEFIYHLRLNLKEKENINEISILDENKNLSIDEKIGHHLYNWIFKNEDNILINEDIINKTIKDITVCNDDNEDYCYYKFRDQYRSIPSLAYTIGIKDNNNKTKDLKIFLKNLPQIITIDKFTFERNMEQDISNYENIQYKGSIEMKLHGKNINNEELKNISNLLGTKCIGKDLNPKNALKLIDDTLINIGNINQVNSTSTNSIRELQSIINQINEEYDDFNKYKKTIKLFEIYRMLKDNNLCQV